MKRLNFYSRLLGVASVCAIAVSGTFAQAPYSLSCPRPGGTLVVQNDLTFSINYGEELDSIIWTIGEQYAGAGSYLSPTLNVTSDFRAQVMVFTKARCIFIDTLSFFGVRLNGTGTLTAPVIRNATYAWYLEDVLIPDATSVNFTPTIAGNYKVILTWNTQLRTEGSQEARTAEFRFTVRPEVVTGLHNNETVSGDMLVYPNPASGGSINITTKANGPFEYVINNAQGMHVLHGNGSGSEAVNVTALAPGIYYVQTRSADHTAVTPVVIR